MMGGRNDMANRSGRHNQRGSIGAIISKRQVSSSAATPATNFNFNSSPPNTSAWIESDSNADTCCLGSNFVITQYTERTADVYPYSSSYTPLTNVLLSPVSLHGMI